MEYPIQKLLIIFDITSYHYATFRPFKNCIRNDADFLYHSYDLRLISNFPDLIADTGRNWGHSVHCVCEKKRGTQKVVPLISPAPGIFQEKVDSTFLPKNGIRIIATGNTYTATLRR